MADRRASLIPLIIFLWILLQPDPQRVRNAQYDARPLIQDAIADEQLALSVVQNSTWDPLFATDGHRLNLTGLEQENSYAWDALPIVKARAREHLEYALGEWGTYALEHGSTVPNPVALYNNVTGNVRGGWRRSKLEENVPVPTLNLSAYAPPGVFGQAGIARPFGRNITGDHGDISIRFNERESALLSASSPLDISNITELGVEMSITNSQSYTEWEFRMRGVYFADVGQAILTTNSDKFRGIFLLPHLSLSNRTFEDSRSLLNESIGHTIQSQIDRRTESLNPWAMQGDGNQDALSDAPDCDMIIYLQQLAPVTSVEYPAAVMNFLEHELRSPSGAFLPTAPDLRFSMLAFSPDCGYVLESQGPPTDFVQQGNHLTGPKVEVSYLQGRRHLLLFTLSIALQLFLLMRQMREASTPSTRSRISFYTIATLALGDGFATLAFLLISVLVSGLWVNLVGTAFLAFISVSFFGMRFLLDIWQVQAPERERRVREEIEEERRREQALNATIQRIRAQRDAAQQAQAQDGTTATVQTADTLPNPATSPERPLATELPPPTIAIQRPIDTGATPVFMPSDQEGLEPVAQATTTNPTDINAAVQARLPSFMSLYSRFYMLLLVTLFLCLNATAWPAPLRRAFFTLLGLAYFSFWVPQIHRNVQRNCRHALNWEFVLGQSVLRLVPFCYFYGYKDNVLLADINYYGLGMLAIWVWVQVVILVSQEWIGPRWFIRKTWAPPAYDYHPILREDEEGATMPIGFSQSTRDASAPSSPIDERSAALAMSRRASIAKDTKEKGKRTFDCAICMQDLEVPVVEAGSSASDAGLAGGLLARRTYMVTPCRHIFHSSCLEGWMKYRLQCPICRETLPPL